MTPSLAIIGGSGLYEIDSLEVIERHNPITPFGETSDDIIEGTLAGRTVFFLPRHGKGHRLLAHEINHRANIWALRSLGARWAVSVTAVGSLKEELAPRDVVVPDQLVDRLITLDDFPAALRAMRTNSAPGVAVVTSFN